MNRRLSLIGGAVTLLAALLAVALGDYEAALLAGFVGGVAVGVVAEHWDDPVIDGGVAAMFGGAMLFGLLTVVTLALPNLFTIDSSFISVGLPVYVTIAGLVMVPVFGAEGALGGAVGTRLAKVVDR